jgi:probable F420-dependent oxidoreductase
MQVDGQLGGSLDQVGERARELEAGGYDGGLAPEIDHDPFLPLLLAAEHTERLQIGTAVGRAVAPTPRKVAATANDLQLASRGRFALGLGSQIKPHIERRFSMPWSHPARRMREFVLAMRAIWSAWETGERLDFKGEFYTHTLMTPYFDPGPNPHGAPKVFLAAVGDGMTEVAGEVADGMILHSFTTERYIREVTVPALERGFARAGKTRADFTISGPAFVVSGTTDEEWESARRAAKAQIAFYGSTPGYRGVLELHGWGDLGVELHRLSRKGAWVAMGELISDDVLDTFAIVAAPDEIAPAIVARFGALLDRVGFGMPPSAGPDVWRRALDAVHAAG